MLFKGIGQVVLSAALILYLVFAPVLVFPYLKAENNEINKENKLDYYGVLELWNVDTFEGGSVARSRWLEVRAMEFENNNPGVFVMVKNMTINQALLNLANGNKPNLISYGIGFGHNIIDYILPYSGTVNVRDDLLKGGQLNGLNMAIPFILGGYSVIGNEHFMGESFETTDFSLENNLFDFNTTYYNEPVYSLSLGANSLTNPALALALNTNLVATENSIDPKINELDSYTAYEGYVLKNNCSTLLGTQRDVYRCKNRENNGNMDANQYWFLEGFSDLIQYISVFSSDAKTESVCEEYINYITTEQAQKTLSKINMFNVLGIKIYSTPFYREWEKILNEPLSTLNVFLHEENIKEKIDIAIKALKGDEESKNIVNNMFWLFVKKIRLG